MKHKVSELEGPRLDYWVGKALGLDVVLEQRPLNPPKDLAAWLIEPGARLPDFSKGPYAPSTDWAQGGPLIEREGVNLKHVWDESMLRPPGPRWLGTALAGNKTFTVFGDAPLHAAMRALVASKLGAEVEA